MVHAASGQSQAASIQVWRAVCLRRLRGSNLLLSVTQNINESDCGADGMIDARAEN